MNWTSLSHKGVLTGTFVHKRELSRIDHISVLTNIDLGFLGIKSIIIKIQKLYKRVGVILRWLSKPTIE